LRVHGEWLELTETQYQEALSLTTNMAAEAETHLPALEAAENLKSVSSNGLVLSPPNHILDIRNELSLAKLIVKTCGEALELIKETIAQFVGEDGTEGIASIQERKGRMVFNVEQFKQENLELFDQYQIDKSSWQQRFTLSKVESDLDVETFSPGLTKQIENLAELCSGVKSAEDLVNVHSIHVQLLSREARAQWVASLQEALLKSTLGENEGFEGVCKWPRVEKIKKVLDEKALSNDYPELFEKYLRQTESTQAVVIQPMVSY
jgi:hypothetical protein